MARLRDKSTAGTPVMPGPPGKDAYELAITRGVFSGTFDQWIASLKGDRGDDGDDGLSAYGLALKNGFQGTEAEWLKSLPIPGRKGDPGMRGPPGPIGPMPEHEWRGTELRFQMTPDQWGPFVDLKGDPGKAATGGGGVVILNDTGYFPGGWD